MQAVFACVDALADSNASAVVDAASWAAARLDAPLELLHVIERRPGPAAATDYSGAIGLGAQESLLDELTGLDEKRGRIAQEVGRQMLAAATVRARESGATRVATRLRHGDLTDAVLELEPEARLLVLGEHAHKSQPARRRLDHHVERVVRAVGRPVMVVPSAVFVRPERFVVAFDDSPTARGAVSAVASSPWLRGLPVELVAAGDMLVPLDDAAGSLRAAGFDVTPRRLKGEPARSIPAMLKAQEATMLIMGAYGHSRVRHLFIGSTTTALLRECGSPVLVLR